MVGFFGTPDKERRIYLTGRSDQGVSTEGREVAMDDSSASRYEEHLRVTFGEAYSTLIRFAATDVLSRESDESAESVTRDHHLAMAAAHLLTALTGYTVKKSLKEATEATHLMADGLRESAVLNEEEVWNAYEAGTPKA